MNFLHTFEPHSVLAQLGPVSIHWYGLCLALGALAGVWVAVRLAQRYGIAADTMYDYIFWLIVCSLVGDRLYYVVYAWSYYGSHLADIPKIWEGGLAIHGALIVGPVVAYIFAKKHALSWKRLLDITVVGVILGQAIGRWGNYFNQELFGTPTSLPWGIPISPEHRPVQYVSETYFHPTFLYESLWNLAVFALLYAWHRRVLEKKSPRTKEGDIVLAYIILYSIGRMAMETLRTDFTPYIFGIRAALFVSACMALLCAAILVLRRVRPAHDQRPDQHQAGEY